jgi:hypothetical protein
MRKLLVLAALAALAVPAASQADRPQAQDGCLVVDGAYGTVTITAHGALIGRLGSGTLTVEDLDPNDSSKAKVSGYDQPGPVHVSKTRTKYVGAPDLRFRFTGGGPFRIIADATDIDLSVVGWGRAVLDGSKYTQQGGSYSGDSDSLCSSNVKSFPVTPTTVTFGSPGSG